MGVTVEGEGVRLRDVSLDDADLLDSWSTAEAKGGFNDFGIPHAATDRDVLARGPLRNEHNGELIIERVADGQPIGTVSWRLERYGPNDESGAWNIGIALIPEARGQGHGTEAQRLVAGFLFATTPLHRVEASTDVENLAEQRSLEKAGFTREGVLRGVQYRAGAWHDLVNYARLRDDD
ncbi:MAG: GNAT family N-acetyltransferase [Candidatus Limnocylindrales bacterium]